MIHINLLPHREEKRKARRQQFFVLAGLVSVLAVLVIFLGHSIIEGYVSKQRARNEFLKAEIGTLDKQIEEIKKLRDQTQALLARKQVIESLQRDRSEAVHLLSEMVIQVPEGIYLKSLKQEGSNVFVVGYAQSNSRVSMMMRNIEASPWLERPVLAEIKAVTVEKRRLNEFSLSFSMKRSVEKVDGVKASAAGGRGK